MLNFGAISCTNLFVDGHELQCHGVEVAVNLILGTWKMVFKILDLTPFPLSERDKISELRVRVANFFMRIFNFFKYIFLLDKMQQQRAQTIVSYKASPISALSWLPYLHSSYVMTCYI